MSSASAVSEIDNVLAGYQRTRQDLIPILQDVQDRLGFLSEEAVRRVAEHVDLSPNDVFGVATFYTQFRFHPPGKHHVKVCQGTACHVRRSPLIMEEISRRLGISAGETTEDRQFSLQSVACFGSCALAPVVVLGDRVYGRMTPRKMEKLIEEHRDES